MYSWLAGYLMQDSGRMKAKKKKEKKTLGVEQLGFEYQVRSDISPEEEAQNKVYDILLCNTSIQF